MLEILAYGFLIVVGIGLGILTEKKNLGGAASFMIGFAWGLFVATIAFIYYRG